VFVILLEDDDTTSGKRGDFLDVLGTYEHLTFFLLNVPSLLGSSNISITMSSSGLKSVVSFGFLFNSGDASRLLVIGCFNVPESEIKSSKLESDVASLHGVSVNTLFFDFSPE